jgi:hypothetical protein
MMVSPVLVLFMKEEFAVYGLNQTRRHPKELGGKLLGEN